MEIIAVSRCVFHARQVIRHGAAGKVTDSLIGRAGIQGVRSMGENFFNPMFFCKWKKFSNIFWIDVFGFGTARIPGKKLKRIGIYFDRFLSHGEIAAGRGKMTSNCKHD